MPKPILLSVDDDSDVLRAIERDLRSEYGAEYRVIGSDSPEGALDLLKQLKVRNDSVALLLADQRMPKMDGVAFLQEAQHVFRMQNVRCSPHMPTRTQPSAPLIKPVSTTSSSSPGIRRRSTCIHN
jgi:CheY-like chemotaxis protein